MKTICLIFLFLLGLQFNTLAQENIYDKSSYSRELAKRFLKLGNTYREAQNYDKANHYLTKGINLAKKYKQKYWMAVGYEYHGYLQRDIGNIDQAKEFLLKAKAVYDQVISQCDGSQKAIEEAINSIGTHRVISSSHKDDEIFELKKENQFFKNSNEEYLSKITTLEDEIKSLKDQLSIKNNNSDDNKKPNTVWEPDPTKQPPSSSENPKQDKNNDNQEEKINKDPKELPKTEAPKVKVKRPSLPPPL